MARSCSRDILRSAARGLIVKKKYVSRAVCASIAIAALSFALVAGHRTHAQEEKAPTSAHGVFVVFLGTGMPRPDPNRQGPSLAIVANGKAYIVDAGVGVA